MNAFFRRAVQANQQYNQPAQQEAPQVLPVQKQRPAEIDEEEMDISDDEPVDRRPRKRRSRQPPMRKRRRTNFGYEEVDNELDRVERANARAEEYAAKQKFKLKATRRQLEDAIRQNIQLNHDLYAMGSYVREQQRIMAINGRKQGIRL